MNIKKKVSTILVILVTLLFLLPILVQSDNQTSQKRIFLTFNSQEEKQQFLETYNTNNKFQLKSDKQIKTLSQVLGKEKKVKQDYGELSTITLDVTLQEEADLIAQLPQVKIQPVGKKELLLAQSVPLINATEVWKIQQRLQTNQTILENLTGIGQSVCIIDTGINASHADFTGKLIVQKCYCTAHPGFGRNSDCCPGGTGQESNASDDHGHGTHVSGIAAANGVVKGVAPQANIISVKAFDSTGNAFDDDILNAIQYCTNQSATYNISVISMSLGGGSYATTCPSDPLASGIYAALAKNISVVVASGNSGSSVNIASPACVPGVTRVGATTKADALASFSDTNSLVSIVAPGVSILSTWKDGNYAQLQGTSMATPHVSGSILLLRQLYTNFNIARNTTQIETLLNSTSKQIYDAGRARNFSRIDIFSALANISLSNISYINQTQTDAQNISQSWFTINVTTYNLLANTMNVSIYNSTTQLIWKQNTTNYTISLNFTAPYDGTFYFNATASNSLGNTSYTATRTVSVDTIYPQIGYLPPTFTDNFTTSKAFFEINISINETNIKYANITIYNSSLAKIWTENSTNSTLYINYTSQSDGTYYYNATISDWVGHTNYTQTRNITVDTTAPQLLNYTISYLTNISANIFTTSSGLGNATLTIWNFNNITSNISNATITLNHKFYLAGLTNNTQYFFNLTFTDSSLNNATFGPYNFTTNQYFIIINTTEWNESETTNFSQYTIIELQNLSGVNFSNNQGKITFIENINITQTLNLTSFIRITQNKIEVNSTVLPEFNRSANLTFRNITITHPIVKRNNVDCSATNGNCTNLSFNSTAKTFNLKVGSFSIYEIVEQCTDGVKNYDETGVDCGGANCSACPTPPPSGGGGGGSSSSRSSSSYVAPPAIINVTNTSLNQTNVTKNITISNINITNTTNDDDNKNNNTNETNNQTQNSPQTIVPSNNSKATLINSILIALIVLVFGVIAVVMFRRKDRSL